VRLLGFGLDLHTYALVLITTIAAWIAHQIRQGHLRSMAARERPDDHTRVLAKGGGYP